MNAKVNAESKFEFDYTTNSGEKAKATLSMADYRQAALAQTDLSNHMANKYPDASAEQGTVLQQMAASVGFTLDRNARNKRTLEAILNGGNKAEVGAVTQPSGQDQSIGARLLMPQLILGMQEQNLWEDQSKLRTALMAKTGMNTQINQKAYFRPVVNSDTNADYHHSEITQGAKPNTLIRIQTTENAWTLPTRSFGLTITQEALASSTLDQVAMMVGSARRGIDNANVHRWIANCVTGNDRYGIAALVAENVSTIDAAATGGAMTQEAWIRILLRNQATWEADTIICGIGSMQAIDGRANRPTVTDDIGTDKRMKGQLNVMNADIDDMDCILLNDTAPLGGAANILVFDSQQFFEHVQNTTASYEAVESYVMTKTEEMRYDVAEDMYRWRDDACSLIARA